MSFLVHHSKFDEWMKPEAHNFVLMLEHCHRFTEARRICRASIEMCDGENPELQHVAAVLDIELGELQRGLNDLRRLIPLVEPSYSLNLQQSLARGQVLEGSMTMPQAVTFGGDSPSKWARLANTAIALEQAEDIDLLLKRGVGTGRDKVSPEHASAVQLSCLLEVLREGGATPAQRMLVHLENTEQKQDAITRFREQAMVAQLFRLGKQRKQAIKHMLAADKLLTELDPELMPLIENRILHARNVLALIALEEKDAVLATIRERAAKFIGEHRARGYHSLKDME